ncbi:hypothetical protein GCM10022199_25360 [Marihabitans asiaticum]|uniref:GT2 family glycosyltransferase n=1 Tax=Marihabitans asiaticum TaxID=415218 RepID=A0A560WCL5_9MICO|nr:GT2 family glycosyltransferase [Marihabitans asiaticum]
MVSAILLARTRPGTELAVAALAAQVEPPERLVVVDVSEQGLDELDELYRPAVAAGISVQSSRGSGSADPRRSLQAVVEDLREHTGRRDLLWFLSSRCVPEPEALRELLAVMGRGVAMATPKLVDVEDRAVLVRQGLQVTRAGVLVPTPQLGERDQGQHDGMVDAVAGPLEGLLVDRDSYLALGGHDLRLGDLGADLDLGWRAQRTGRRVVVAPRARIGVAPSPDEVRPGLAHRAQARRTALARGPWWAYPFRAVGGAVLGLLAALSLLLLKRPRESRERLALVRGSLDPRTVRSLRHRGGTALVDRADLDSLFVTRGAAWQRSFDDLRGHDSRSAVGARELEPDRASALLSPVPYLVIAAVGMAAWAGRNITGELRHRFDAGLVGGELLGGRATSTSLLAMWRDAWNGGGVGAATERSPAYLILAGLTWLVEHVPGLGRLDSPAGVALAMVVLCALPLAAVVAYRAARVVTGSRWVRFVLALGWVSTPVAAAAAGQGRVGPLVALILLPRIGAGLARACRASGTFSDSVRTALWAAVLASLMPMLAVPVLLVGLGLLLLGSAPRRLRGAALLLLPPILVGPWLLTLRDDPARLLTGWGALRVGESPQAWRLAAAAPGGPGEIPLYWYLPVAVLAVLGLLWARRPLAWGAGLAVLVGTAMAVGSPFVGLGEVPPGAPEAGMPMHPWPGLGGLVLALGVLTLAGLSVSAWPAARSRIWSVVRTVPSLVLAVGVAASVVLVAQQSFGEELTTWREPRPQVAVADAESLRSGRSLVLDSRPGEISYQLVGREPSDLVRDLPTAPSDEGVAQIVAALLGVGPELDQPVDQALGAWGVGYVVAQEPTAEDAAALDAAPGLRRLGASAGNVTWAVRPTAAQDSTPSRARLVGEDGEVFLAGLGDHSDAASVELPAVPADSQLVIAESLDWTEHALVEADGEPLVLDTRSSMPTYAVPEGTESVSVDLGDGHRIWKLVQLVVLLLALYLALPTERRAEPVVSR